MRLIDIAVKFVAALTVSSLLMVANYVTYVSAEGTNVSAEVCQVGAVPGLTITGPVSDSLHTQPSIAVTGDVSNVTQVDIYVDGNYSRTVAVARDSDQFQSFVTLSGGTHTIRASGTPLCGGGPAEDEVVVTYRPVVLSTSGSTPPSGSIEPSSGVSITSSDKSATSTTYGRELPTVINPELPGDDGEEVFNAIESGRQNTNADKNLTLFERLWRLIGGSQLGQWLGIDSDVVPTFQSISIVWLRGLLIIVGLILLTCGRRLINFSKQVRNSSASRRAVIDYAIRALGIFLVLISLAFV